MTDKYLYYSQTGVVYEVEKMGDMDTETIAAHIVGIHSGPHTSVNLQVGQHIAAKKSMLDKVPR